MKFLKKKWALGENIGYTVKIINSNYIWIAGFQGISSSYFSVSEKPKLEEKYMMTVEGVEETGKFEKAGVYSFLTQPHL